MSENKNELEYISSDNGNLDTVAYGQTVDLELLNEKWVAEKKQMP